MIDPVDGTHEFVAGGKDYATSVAVMRHGRLDSAALYFPMHDNLLLCQRDKGIFINGTKHTASDRKARLKTVETGTLGVSPRQVDLHVMQDLMTEKSLSLKPISAVTPKSAAVILGQVYASLSFPVPNSAAYIWDYAAAALFLREMGLGFYSLDGEDLSEKLPISHPHGWFAGSDKLRDELFDGTIDDSKIRSGVYTVKIR